MQDIIVLLTETQFLGKDLWLWLLFLGIVIVLLVLDLGVLHKGQREIKAKESLILSAGYIGIAVLFGAWIWHGMGAEAGMNYLTGFFIEKSLALDNIFVISLIFSYFAVPKQYQHRVLFWGIIGVIVMRGVMIGVGAALVSKFDWILYIFALFLIITGIKMWLSDPGGSDMSENRMINFLRSRLRITDQLHGEKFFIKQTDAKTLQLVWFATPLFLALIMIEFVDLVFAVDSIPAIFAITTDPYIVYTSNIFAILGLRALYFALASLMHRFIYLKYALSAVLIFIGGKIFWGHLVGKVDPVVSLLITLGILAAGIVFSLVKTKPVIDRKELV